MEIELIVSYTIPGLFLVYISVLLICRKDYYFIYDHRLLFVIGLVFSRTLVKYAVLNVIIWYFTYYNRDLVMSAVLTIIQDSLSSLLVIFMANASDTLVGKFRTLVFSNTASIGGLLLLWIFNPYDVDWLLVFALVLLAFGASGDNLLYNILVDLVKDIEKQQRPTEKQSTTRALTWFRIAYVSGAISATLWFTPYAVGGVYQSWRSSFLVCIISMAIASTTFATGYKFYHKDDLVERPVEIVFRVLHAYIQKLLKSKLRCLTGISRDASPRNLENRMREDERWKEDMMVIKSLIKMVPMWGTFFIMSLLLATGRTFFYAQYQNLNTSNEIAVQIYSLVQDLACFLIPFLYRWIFRLHQNEKVKIGVGMLCAIICCVFAWKLEVHRLKEVKRLVGDDENTSISFLWLVPQFFVLGCMEGLTTKGYLSFYKSQMKDKPIWSYGEEYIEVVMGFGKLFNIFLILIFQKRGWLGDTINDSQLDKYYIVLICICSANFILYCCIATCYYKEAEQMQELTNDDLQQDFDLL